MKSGLSGKVEDIVANEVQMGFYCPELFSSSSILIGYCYKISNPYRRELARLRDTFRWHMAHMRAKEDLRVEPACLRQSHERLVILLCCVLIDANHMAPPT